MLFPRRGVGSPPRAWVPLGAFLCATLVAISATIPVDKCPRTLDCAREGRHFCQPGSSHCGPCLTPLEENEEGMCVVRKRHAHFGKVSSRPELDEEIDFLSSIISKQQETEVKHSGSPQTQARCPQTEERTPLHHRGSHSDRRPYLSPQTTAQPDVRIVPVGVPVPNLAKDGLLVAMIGLCIVVGTVALILAGICWIRLQRGKHYSQKVDYPAFNVMAPHSGDCSVTGDKKLAHSAQMYHYQHQKQQILSLEKHRDEPKVPDSGTTSDEENEDGDFTVYECPGLAPTGEMEVKNPLFDDSTLQRNHK